LRAALLATEKNQRQSAIESYIQAEIARVLRMDPSRIDPAKRLTSLGLDSLMAYELKARIESDLGIGLPMVKLVGGPSICELGAYLLSQLDSTASSSAASPGDLPLPIPQIQGDEDEEQIISKLEHFSDEQVESLLSDFSAEERELAKERRP
jgi:acyl carrier protein